MNLVLTPSGRRDRLAEQFNGLTHRKRVALWQVQTLATELPICGVFCVILPASEVHATDTEYARTEEFFITTSPHSDSDGVTTEYKRGEHADRRNRIKLLPLRDRRMKSRQAQASPRQSREQAGRR